MGRVPIEIPPGLNSDDTSYAAAGGWADASNIRWRNGRWQTIGGWESLTVELLSGVCRTVFPWTDNTGQINVAFGTHATLELWIGGELFNITPVGLVAGAVDGAGSAGYGVGQYGIGPYGEPSIEEYFARTWSLSNYGESLMANPRGATIYWWQNDTGTPAEPLTGAPEEVSFMLVNPQRQVMAFGCNEEISGDFNGLAIRFSDLENPEDWTTTPINNAGEVILGGGGRLVGARVVGRHVFTWTDSGLYLGIFVGDPAQTWRFDKVGDNCGLIGPNAAVVVGQTAYWLSPDGQFYACPLGGTPEPIPCPIRSDFWDHLAGSQADKVVASSCAAFSEIRFDYPDDRDGFENSRYLSLNLKDGVWARGLMARAAYVDAAPADSPIGVTPDGHVYWHERGNSADGLPISWFIETADQHIGDNRRQMMIRDMEPDFQDQVGPLSVTLFTRDYPQAVAETYGPYMFLPGDEFLDFRAEGRLARIRFSGSSSPCFARMGRPSFDLVGTGQR
jgi:hypothetical protein